MTKNIRLLGILFMAVWAATVDAHYYNNVRVNDTPVRCLAQTDDELIWLGTGSGLYCYDGYRAIPKHGLSNAMRATIYSMLSNGHLLYVGTSSGFYIYDTTTGLYDEPVQLRKEVRALEKVNQNILLGLSDGLWEYDTASRRLRLLCSGLSDIYSILYVDDTVYIGTLKGLFAYANGKTVELKLNNVATPSVFSLMSDDIIDDGTGRLWVAAYSGGIFIVSKEKLLAGGDFVVADRHLDCRNGGLSFLWVRQLAKDCSGHVWARTGKGLDRIDITTLRVTNMAKSDPGCMVADKHGNIWTANADGLLCYTNSGKPLRHSYGVGQENADAVALCDVNGNEVFSAKIRILPPWYLSWWAKAFYLLLSVASVLWLSRFYLMRKQLAKEKRDKQLIMQLTGVSPVEYIRNIRMEKAGLLLREGKFSVSEVMYMVGFTKSGYFSKCFQEAFGMTPSAYIRNTSH